MIEIPVAAGVARSTLYRHVASRRALEEALLQKAAAARTAPAVPGERRRRSRTRHPGSSAVSSLSDSR